MNEKELKELWQRDAAPITAPTLDFNIVRQNMRGWEKKLRRKIKIDIFANAAVYVLFSPLFFIYPETLYLVPLLLLIWIWYLRETLRIYRRETDFTEFASTREYLETKKRFLKNYISRTRVIAYLVTPPGALVGLYYSGYFFEVLQILSLFIAILIFVELLTIVAVEIYVRQVYVPTIKELNELLRQLETD